jgi:hypothetical protein
MADINDTGKIDHQRLELDKERTDQAKEQTSEAKEHTDLLQGINTEIQNLAELQWEASQSDIGKALTTQNGESPEPKPSDDEEETGEEKKSRWAKFTGSISSGFKHVQTVGITKAISSGLKDMMGKKEPSSAAREDEGKEKGRWAKLTGAVTSGFKGMQSMAGKAMGAIKGKLPSMKTLLMMGVAGAILALMNSPAMKIMKDFILDTVIPGIAKLWETVFKPLWTDFLSWMEDPSWKNFGKMIGDNKIAIASILALLAPKLLFGGLLKVIGLIKPAFALISKLIGFAGGGAVGAASILGILAAAYVVIRALWKSVEAFQEHFESTGSVIASLGVATKEFLAQLIGYPLNLIKDLVSWAATKLGAHKLAAKLDEFSFVDIVKKSIDGYVMLFEKLFDIDWKGLVKSILPGGKIGGWISDWLFGDGKKSSAELIEEKKEQLEAHESRAGFGSKEVKKKRQAEMAGLREEIEQLKKEDAKESKTELRGVRHGRRGARMKLLKNENATPAVYTAQSTAEASAAGIGAFGGAGGPVKATDVTPTPGAGGGAGNVTVVGGDSKVGPTTTNVSNLQVMSMTDNTGTVGVITASVLGGP